MNGFSFLCLMIAAGLALRVAMIYANSRGLRDERQLEYERHYDVVQQDPSNAGSYARLAEMLYEDNQVDDAVSAWRRAVYLMPQGPFTNKWKRDLKRALEVQASLDRGEKPLQQSDFYFCPRCEAQVLKSVTVCPNCGETLHLSFARTIAQPDVAKSWIKETLAVTAVLVICGIIFSALPMEVKGTLLIATAMVIAYFVVRAFIGKD